MRSLSFSLQEIIGTGMTKSGCSRLCSAFGSNGAKTLQAAPRRKSVHVGDRSEAWAAYLLMSL